MTLILLWIVVIVINVIIPASIAALVFYFVARNIYYVIMGAKIDMKEKEK